MIKRIEIKISGLVQGVGVRFSINKRSRELKLSGWVRNESDGTVSAIVEGDEKDLAVLIGYCKNGLKFAKVMSVEVEWCKAFGGFKDFEIKY